MAFNNIIHVLSYYFRSKNMFSTYVCSVEGTGITGGVYKVILACGIFYHNSFLKHIASDNIGPLKFCSKQTFSLNYKMEYNMKGKKFDM